jgi:hypothetical protein
LVTRDALKELAAAASRLQRLPAHRGDLAHGARGGSGSGGGATSSSAAAGLLGAARRERAPPARLLSSRTPSADALLHSLQALSRDVDSKALPSVLHNTAGTASSASANKAVLLATQRLSSPAPVRRARSATPTAGGRRRGSVATAVDRVTSVAGYAGPAPPAATVQPGRFAAAAAAARGGIATPMPGRARAASPERVRRGVGPAQPPTQSLQRAASAGAMRAPSRGRAAAATSPAPMRPATLRPAPGALYAAAAAAASTTSLRASGGAGSRGGTPTAARGRAGSPAGFGAATLRLRMKA